LIVTASNKVKLWLFTNLHALVIVRKGELYIVDSIVEFGARHTVG
jgi:hypothetical protein